MNVSKPAMKMPELLVFARLFVAGFVGAEIYRVTFYLSASFAKELIDVSIWFKVFGILVGLALCLTVVV